MSLPSINAKLKKFGKTAKTATEEEMRDAFIESAQEDLPLGYAEVEILVGKLKNGDKDRVMHSLKRASTEGEQYARLLGPNVFRHELGRHFGVALGFHNCCTGVVANDEDSLNMTLQEQIELQDPSFIDC